MHCKDSYNSDCDFWIARTVTIHIVIFRLQCHVVFDAHANIIEEHAASKFRFALFRMRIDKEHRNRIVGRDNRNNANGNDWVDSVTPIDRVGAWILLGVY